MNLFEATATLTMDTSGFIKGIKTVQETKSGISNFFQKISGAADTAKNGISVFGDVLKANLLSEAITKGFDTIVSGFQKVGSMADNFVKSSISAGMSFDSAMSQVYATMGDKASEMVEYNGQMMQSTEALRQFAKEMGATTKYSATESAQALNYMALAGYNAETSMKMLPNVMNLASAGAFDLATASNMLTDTQTAFGMDLERTNQLVDEMAAAASNSNTSVRQLGDAFLTVGGLAKELNGGFVTLANGATAPVDGIQELEIALGAMANAGIKGSEAGTHMRNLLMKLSSPTDDAKQLFEELGISVFDASGNMKSLKDVFGEMQNAFAGMNNQQKKLEAISEIFNARDTASATALLAAVEQSWDSLGEAILNAEGAAEKMSQTQMNNLAGAKKIFDSAKEGLQISISDALSPLAAKFVNFGAESLQALTNTIEKEGTKGLRGAVAKIVKNAGNLLYKNVPELLKNVVKVLTAIKNGIADGLPSFMDSMRAMIAKTASYMEKELPEFIKAGQRITSEIGKGITRNFPYIIKAVSKIAKVISKSVSSNLPVIIPAVTSGILTIIDELTKPERITDFIDVGTQFIIAIGSGIGRSAYYISEKLPEIVENLKQGFEDNKNKITGIGDTIISAIAGGFGITKNWEIIKGKIVTGLSNTFGEISFSDTVDNIVTGLANALDREEWKSVKEKISNGIQNIDFSEITSNLSKLIIGVTDSTGKLIDGIDWSVIGGAIGEALNGVDWYGILNSVFKTIATAIKNAPELLKSIAEKIDSETATQIATIGVNLLTGKQIISGIASYISSTAAFQTVSTALSGMLAKCAPVIGSAIVGWDIGTLIRESIISDKTVSEIDEFVAGIVDTFKDGGYRIKATFATLLNNPEGLTQDQMYKRIALEETASGAGFQSNAYTEEVLKWGKDLAANFGNGISKSKEIENAIQDKLNWIHDNMGFSVPKEGILSDFDTYSPDMMKLFADGIKSNAPLVIAQIESFASSLKTKFSEVTSETQKTWDVFWADTNAKAKSGTDEFKTIVQAIPNKFKEIINGANHWGSDIISNLINGVNAKWNEWNNTWENVGGVVYDLLHHSTPEKGLLKDDDKWMPDMMKNFISGINQNVPALRGQAENAVSAIQTAFARPVTMGDIGEINVPELPNLEYDARQNVDIHTNLIDTAFKKINEIAGKVIDIAINWKFNSFEIPELPGIDPENVEVHTSLIDTVTKELDEIGNRIIDVVVNGKFESFEMPILQPQTIDIGSRFNGFEIPELPEIALNSHIISDQDEFNPEDKTVNIFTNFIDTASQKLDEIGNRIINIMVNGKFDNIDIPESQEVTVRRRFTDFDVSEIPDFETDDIQANITFFDNLDELFEKFRNFKDNIFDTNFNINIPNINTENIKIPEIKFELPKFSQDELKDRKINLETEITEIKRQHKIYENAEYYTMESEPIRKAYYRPQQQIIQNNNSDDMQAVIGLLNSILSALQEREVVIPIDTFDTALGLKQANESRWAMA